MGREAGTEASGWDGVGHPGQSRTIPVSHWDGTGSGTEASGWDGVGHPGQSHSIPVGTLGWDGKLGLRPLGGMVWDILGSPVPPHLESGRTARDVPHHPTYSFPSGMGPDSRTN